MLAEMETIHIYYEPEEEPTPPNNAAAIGILFGVLFCAGLVAWMLFVVPEHLETVSVPAHFLPLKQFSVAETIIPTGVKTYPAIYATGTLTITNGSIISQTIPQGFIVDGVATDMSVFVPAGSASGYGEVTVTAHALQGGKKGNMLPGTINVVEGSSVYIRNLTPFTGGRDAYSVTYITPEDRRNALTTARAVLLSLVPQKMLDTPCHEAVKDLRVTWTCRYVTYTPPVFFRVVGIAVRGKTIVLYGYAVVRPRSAIR